MCWFVPSVMGSGVRTQRWRSVSANMADSKQKYSFYTEDNVNYWSKQVVVESFDSGKSAPNYR